MTQRWVRDFETAATKLIPSMHERTDEELERISNAYLTLMPHVVFERVYREKR